MLAVEAGHCDMDDSTFLYVHGLSFVVAGDVCYNSAAIHEMRNSVVGLSAMHWRNPRH